MNKKKWLKNNNNMKNNEIVEIRLFLKLHSLVFDFQGRWNLWIGKKSKNVDMRSTSTIICFLFSPQKNVFFSKLMKQIYFVEVPRKWCCHVKLRRDKGKTPLRLNQVVSRCLRYSFTVASADHWCLFGFWKKTKSNSTTLYKFS